MAIEYSNQNVQLYQTVNDLNGQIIHGLHVFDSTSKFIPTEAIEITLVANNLYQRGVKIFENITSWLEEVELHYKWVKIYGQEEIDIEQNKLMEQAKEEVNWLHSGEKYVTIVGVIVYMNSHDLVQ